MGKFFKTVGKIAATAAVAFGAYCAYKKFIEKKENIFDDDEDGFGETDFDDDNSKREYVSINIEDEEESKEDKAE